MTTLAVRAQEQAIERRAAQLAQPAGRDVGDVAREHAAREVAERIGGPLSPEQHHALEVLTGPERAAVLVGPAGTGKGVVIDAAARAEQHAGRETIGVAVSGLHRRAARRGQPRAGRTDAHPGRAGRAREHGGHPRGPRHDGDPGRGGDGRPQAPRRPHRAGGALRGEADRRRRRQAAPLDRPRRHVRPAHRARAHRRTRRHPPHQGPRRPARMASTTRRRTRARDGALRLTRPAAPLRHPRPGGRASRTNMGHAHGGPRYPRGRVDRRRLQPGDRPAQRPRPTPTRTSAANSDTTRSRCPASTTAYAKAT